MRERTAWRHTWILAALLMLPGNPALVEAQQVVTVSAPPAVSFAVANVAVTTVGSPSPVTISFLNAAGFLGGQRLRISVRADSSTFSGPPGSTGIPASAVSWVVTAAQRGTGSNGALSAVAYTEVFRSGGNVMSGSAAVSWRLAPLSATGLRAGPQTLTIRWMIEAL